MSTVVQRFVDPVPHQLKPGRRKVWNERCSDDSFTRSRSTEPVSGVGLRAARIRERFASPVSIGTRLIGVVTYETRDNRWPVMGLRICAAGRLGSRIGEPAVFYGGGEGIPVRWSEGECGSCRILRIAHTDHAVCKEGDLDAVLAAAAVAALEPASRG